MASGSNQYTFIFHSGGSSQVGPQMVLRVLKITTKMTLKLMMVHSIADFNREGQPTLCNQNKNKKHNSFYGKQHRTVAA
jgi:hypothetical protein